MAEDILNPAYWQQRLRTATQLHHAIFRCPLERWLAIEEQHRKILARLIKPGDAILDAGCGWGRLISLLPRSPFWYGRYYGIDICPDFIEMAKFYWKTSTEPVLGIPRYWFGVGNLLDLEPLGLRYSPVDWAILISIRPMVKRNLGEEVWQQMEDQLKKVAYNILYLEYDPEDQGEVQCGLSKTATSLSWVEPGS